MTYQLECANTLALQYLCVDCGAEIGERCLTSRGNTARTPHSSRRDPLMQAWAEGYYSCESDDNVETPHPAWEDMVR